MNDSNGVPQGSEVGVAVFANTEIPIHLLFDHIAQGGTFDTFISAYPRVTHGQVISVLEMARAMWGGGGPKAYLVDPGLEMLPVYQQMCRTFSCNEFERRQLEDFADGVRQTNAPSLGDIIADIEKELRNLQAARSS